jgi:hypothetical protein
MRFLGVLADFSLELLITTKSGTSFLKFTAGQPDFSGNSSYVFLGSSGAGAAYWGKPFSTRARDSPRD